MIRAEYGIELHDGPIIAIVGRGGKTITNDAENVIEDLRRAGFLDLVECRVIYLDTCGVWDELLVRDGRFVGFQAIGVSDRAEALAWIKANPGANAPA